MLLVRWNSCSEPGRSVSLGSRLILQRRIGKSLRQLAQIPARIFANYLDSGLVCDPAL
jgi:hypothetical protein